ncbi:hypothetical protein HPB50_004913 [Hyalomma asiaticum]|uniref:Uncharacterized protein n=1 Tax=Hyalomma asiaticum TaxID=266040 RepID=A0ACB7S2U5_HYAAI|nr:hypothetical protein HPB50_004913 [Hyalomma asiaticum]
MNPPDAAQYVRPTTTDEDEPGANLLASACLNKDRACFAGAASHALKEAFSTAVADGDRSHQLRYRPQLKDRAERYVPPSCVFVNNLDQARFSTDVRWTWSSTRVHRTPHCLQLLAPGNAKAPTATLMSYYVSSEYSGDDSLELVRAERQRGGS